MVSTSLRSAPPQRHGMFHSPGGSSGRAQTPLKNRAVVHHSIKQGVSRAAGKRPRVPECAAAARPATQSEGPLLSLRELLGYTGEDKGHWNLSPEWYGNQDGGWGRDAGTTVFSAQSSCGNGQVTVTAHLASSSSSISNDKSGGSTTTCWEQWRVLRFNGTTRQSVNRVTVSTAPAASPLAAAQQQAAVSLTVQPDCLAMEYLKTAASVAAALLGLQQLLPSPAGGLRSSSSSNGGGTGGTDCSSRDSSGQRLHVLCIGVGGGTMPLFLAHHFPTAEVDAVEIDPAVVAAATQAMGFPTDSPRVRLHTADAFNFLQQRQQQGSEGQQPYDLIYMDTFDGQDNVPAALCTPEFAALVAAALHPAHGCFLLNLHSFDFVDTIATFKAALLPSSSGGSGSSSKGSGSAAPGSAFAVAVQRQANACVAIVRGLQLPSDAGVAAQQLRQAAVEVAGQAGYCFPAGSRACRQYQEL